ncbi:MAG: tRNA (adenosine(37)-N6)-threonylcarbamoyltransferase complex dimerization subunit type 1 TsaB [Proteobacteria bacterium]|nr:tRNA (adenosine(37)-N6)-threonylcarbamoyltransferase complex dimerization subunit type 1 TsaB [Pseudomonadota bacterium]
MIRPLHLLALDTATQQATVALCRETAIVAEASRVVTTHSAGLLTLIEDVLVGAGLTLGAVDAIVCGQGPGSFTGLRIGLATAKGLCLAAEKPLLVVGSLLALARAALVEEAAATLALLDAGRGEVYAQAFAAAEPLAPAWLGAPLQVGDYLATLPPRAGTDWLLIGEGALRHADALGLALPQGRPAAATRHTICAAELARATLPRARAEDFDDLARAVPLYVRAPDLWRPAPPANAA